MYLTAQAELPFVTEQYTSINQLILRCSVAAKSIPCPLLSFYLFNTAVYSLQTSSSWSFSKPSSAYLICLLATLSRVLIAIMSIISQWSCFTEKPTIRNAVSEVKQQQSAVGGQSGAATACSWGRTLILKNILSNLIDSSHSTVATAGLLCAIKLLKYATKISTTVKWPHQQEKTSVIEVFLFKLKKFFDIFSWGMSDLYMCIVIIFPQELHIILVSTVHTLFLTLKHLFQLMPSICGWAWALCQGKINFPGTTTLKKLGLCPQQALVCTSSSAKGGALCSPPSLTLSIDWLHLVQTLCTVMSG